MDVSVLDAITNFGALGVVLVLIVTGYLVPKPYYSKLEHENRLLREKAGLDKQRGDEAEEAGRVTSQLISAIADLAAENRVHGHATPAPSPGKAGLSWEDISL